MNKSLKVLEFDRKQKLLEYVNARTEQLTIVSITTSQESYSYKHFLWYYDAR